jgi:hypothetical protein
LPNPSDETPDIGRASWHGTTTRTLRFVLTSPDHKPQRVAAVVVCAAAALVIFAVGRSPVAGTAGIGQTTGALSADPNQKAAPAAPRPAPETSPELEKASGSDRKDPKPELDAPQKVDAPRGPAASPERDAPASDELAPGLVLPATGRAGAGSNPSRAAPPEPAASKPKARPAAAPTPAPKPVVKKAPPAPPPPRSLPPTPARQNSTELDFGI